jgi:hypothetical protein
MKYYLLAISFLFILIANGQYENSSFYFANYKLDGADKFEGFKEADLGYYDLEKTKYKQMILTKDSISVRFGSEIVISKKEAIAKGYTFKDDKMYGIAPLNGVSYKEFNDTILALYYQYDNYFSNNGNDYVQPMDKGYLLFIQERNGFYSVEYLEIKGKKMLIHSLDHVDVMEELLKIEDVKNSEKNGVVTYFANPDLSELKTLIKTKCFDDTREYVLNTDL